MRFEEAEEVLAIGVAGEDSLAVVAALGQMKPVSWRGEAISAGQSGFGVSIYLSEGKNLIYFCRKVAANACRAVSAEGKLLVLMGIGEKSGILVDGTDSP